MGGKIHSYILLVEGTILCIDDLCMLLGWLHFLLFSTLSVIQVKADGSLISEMDLFHHRPYECLVLGYCHQKVSISALLVFD